MVDRSKQFKLERSEKRLYTPYKFSGIDYHFNPEVDKQLVNNMREFTDKYFQRSPWWIYQKMSKLLGDLKEESNESSNPEFDILVKILKVHEKDDFNLEMRIKDITNELWFIIVPKLKFGKLKENDIVRIRSVQMNVV